MVGRKKEEKVMKNLENNAARNILKFGLTKQNLKTAGMVGMASGDVGTGRIYEGRRISLKTLRP